MKNFKFTLVLFLFYSIIYAQLPHIDNSFREIMIKQKAKHYQMMILSEQQKTPNQLDYDVQYYSLELIPDPATLMLSGIVEVVGEVISQTLNHVELNFWEGMTITDIYNSNSPGTQLNYFNSNDIMNIELEREYNKGEIFRITIAYNGKPNDSDYQSFNFDTFNGEPMIWTMSSVFRARGWWPCKDVPSDKPDSMDIRVTVPQNLLVRVTVVRT